MLVRSTSVDGYLTRGGRHYIHAEKLRHNTEVAAALARPGRYRTVAGNLRVKEVAVAPGGDGDGEDGMRAQRFVVCHNPEQAERDAAVRERLIGHLRGLIAGLDTWSDRRRDELVGSFKTKPGLRRYLRRTEHGLLRVDAGAANREAHLDGKWLLRTSDTTLTSDDLAAAYQLGPKALCGDEGAGGELPSPLLPGLALPVAGGGDPSGQLGVGVEQRHRDAGAAGDRREVDRLAALLEGVQGLGRPPVFGPAVVPPGAPQRRAVVSHARRRCGGGRRPPGPTGGPCGPWWRCPR
jgi:hypothetical protein